MKQLSKKQRQQEQRKQLKEERKKIKLKRSAEADSENIIVEKEEKLNILIVCEGENTEVSYFEKFKLSTATIKAVGEGYNTESLVKRAKLLSERGSYDSVWCVFDKDNFKNEAFNNAIKLADKYGFSVAYSNQAFEYWFILHFNDHQGAHMHRDDYNYEINKHLKKYDITYDGNGTKLVSEDFFYLMQAKDPAYHDRPRFELAIDRAKRNYNKLPHNNPATEESSTKVFELAQEIKSNL